MKNRKNHLSFAALFDMDGVLVDNIKYHEQAWLIFAKNHGLRLDRQFFYRYFNGRTNREILEHWFKSGLSKKLLAAYAQEKENLYRKIYQPRIQPLPGLLKFLEKLKKHGVKMVLATAAPPANVKFVLGLTKTKKYFRNVVNAADVKFGKSHPEIYLKAAKKINALPRNCIVFEDSLNGIEAAKRAKMKVVGLATTSLARDLKSADLVIKNFSHLNLQTLSLLFERKK